MSMILTSLLFVIGAAAQDGRGEDASVDPHVYAHRAPFVIHPVDQPPIDAVRARAAAEASLSDLPVFAVHVRPGQVVADIGCGSGRLSLQLAQACAIESEDGDDDQKAGDAGRLYCRDVSERAIATLTKRAAEAEITNIDAAMSRADDVMLPAASIDVALLADVYNIVLAGQEETKAAFVKSIHRAMKPGGVVVVCYVGSGHLLHESSRKRVFEQTVREFTAAGFEPGRRYVFAEGRTPAEVLEFRKPVETSSEP